MPTALDFEGEIDYLKKLDAKNDSSDKMADEGCPNEPLSAMTQAAKVLSDQPPVVTIKQLPGGLKKMSMHVPIPRPLVKKEKKQHGVVDVQHYDLMTVRPLLKTIGARLTRNRYAKTTMREYLEQIQPVSLAEAYLEFYDAHPFYKEVCAGAKHHHWWKGGLEEHVREMIGMGLDLMDLYPGDFTFSKSDVIIVSFLHDFNKIWGYRYITQEDREKNPKKFKDVQVFTYKEGVNNILDGYSQIFLELTRFEPKIVPTNEQWSAVLFHEGGFSAQHFTWAGTSDTSKTINTHNHLAPFLHALDMISSQILGRSIA